jgi:hypothetical protein
MYQSFIFESIANFASSQPCSCHNVLFGHLQLSGPKIGRFAIQQSQRDTKAPGNINKTCKILCQSASALALGASGSEVIGVARARLNVTALERDAQASFAQFTPDWRPVSGGTRPRRCCRRAGTRSCDDNPTHGLASRFAKLNPDVEAHFSSESVVSGGPCLWKPNVCRLTALCAEKLLVRPATCSCVLLETANRGWIPRGRMRVHTVVFQTAFLLNVVLVGAHLRINLQIIIEIIFQNNAAAPPEHKCDLYRFFLNKTVDY